MSSGAHLVMLVGNLFKILVNHQLKDLTNSQNKYSPFCLFHLLNFPVYEKQNMVSICQDFAVILGHSL